MSNQPAGVWPQVVPGWYADPWMVAPLRYHNGFEWTHYLGPPGVVPATGLDPSDASTRWLLPVGRTPLSIVAGYVALFSILLAPAPISLVLGICALVQLKNRPGMYGRGRAIFAIVMGAVFSLVLLAVIVSVNHLGP